jgi:maleate isomerase
VAGTVISVGVLTPHLAVGPEAEFPVMAPGRIVTKVVRIPVGGAGPPPTSALALRALTEPQVLGDAADALLVESIDVIAYASTTSAYAVRFCGEAAMVSRLSRRVGVPVVATCASAVLALRV